MFTPPTALPVDLSLVLSLLVSHRFLPPPPLPICMDGKKKDQLVFSLSSSFLGGFRRPCYLCFRFPASSLHLAVSVLFTHSSPSALLFLLLPLCLLPATCPLLSFNFFSFFVCFKTKQTQQYHNLQLCRSESQTALTRLREGRRSPAAESPPKAVFQDPQMSPKVSNVCALRVRGWVCRCCCIDLHCLFVL